MKKRILMAAVLIGAMFTTSCLDDKESDSVKNVRDAKAQALLAQAELDKAYALVQTADAARITWATEKDKQQFEIDLEAYKAAADARYYASLAAIDASKQLIQSQIDNEITRVYTAYAGALGDWVSLDNDLANAVSELAALEAGIITAEKAAQKTIVSKNVEIAEKQAELDAYTALGSQDVDALNKAYGDAKAQNDADNNVVAAKVKVEKNAQDALDAAAVAFDITKDDAVILATVKAAKELTISPTIATWANVVDATETVDVDATNTVTYYKLFNAQVVAERQKLDTSIDARVRAIGTGGASGTGLTKDAEDARADYQRELTAYNAITNPSAADLNILQGWENAKIAAEVALDDEKKKLEKDRKDLAEFTALVGAFSGTDLTAYNAAVTNLEALNTTLVAASAEVAKAKEVAAVSLGQMNAANTLLTGTENIAKKIATLGDDIQQLRQDIADLEEAKGTGVGLATALLANKELEIQTIEAKIVAKKAEVDRLKSELNTLLA